MMRPDDNVLWYLNRPETKQCKENMDINIAIVGGGMAGLSAAQEFAKYGKKVALFEKYFCGSGVSGKSAGFITPNAELSFTDFAKKFNIQGAANIWNLINSGVETIRTNIIKHNFKCDYQLQDSLVLATNLKSLKTLEKEVETANKINYQISQYDTESIKQHIGSDKYVGGISYPNTFSINAYAYCQELKKHLLSQGVLIFEETPVKKIDDHRLETEYATITADFIIMCVDKNIEDFNMLSHDVYHAQTFLMASEQLTDQQIKTIFPSKNFMAWDTQFIYNYFRLTPDHRLLLGGGDMFTTYASTETHNYGRITKKLTNYLAYYFPKVQVQFEYQWSGLIGISKDIMPIMGRDKKYPHIFYVTASAGLAIACALATYSAQHLLTGRNDMNEYFSPYRKFLISGCIEKIIGKKLSFMLSNLIKMNVP